MRLPPPPLAGRRWRRMRSHPLAAEPDALAGECQRQNRDASRQILIRTIQFGFVAILFGDWYFVTHSSSGCCCCCRRRSGSGRRWRFLWSSGRLWAAAAHHARRPSSRPTRSRSPPASWSASWSRARRNLVRIFEPMLAGHVRGPADAVLPAVRRVLRHRAGLEDRLWRDLCFFPIALNTIAGFSSVDELYLRAVRSMGAGSLAQFRYVYLPAAMPVTLTGLRIGFVICIASVLGGETLAAAAGIGKSIALVGRADGDGAALCLDRLRGDRLGHAQPPGARRRDAQRAGVTR